MRKYHFIFVNITNKSQNKSWLFPSNVGEKDSAYVIQIYEAKSFESF